MQQKGEKQKEEEAQAEVLAKEVAKQFSRADQVLTDIPYWNQQLYSISNNELVSCNCRRRGKCECCCSWFNSFFVLDLIVVVSALVMENLTEILGSMQMYDDVGDHTVVTEAGTFIIFVRCWRILRVFHGAYEAKHKMQAQKQDVQYVLIL